MGLSGRRAWGRRGQLPDEEKLVVQLHEAIRHADEFRTHLNETRRVVARLRLSLRKARRRVAHVSWR
jgi:hypothetical protein